MESNSIILQVKSKRRITLPEGFVIDGDVVKITKQKVEDYE